MRHFFFLIIFFSSTFLFSQKIISFNLFSTSNGVVIKFTVAGGTYCSGFSVQRSLDSLSYNTIGQESSPCNSSANEDKSYTDGGAILNQYNYYKVTLEPGVETTVPHRVYYSKSGNTNLLVYPNPVYEGFSSVTLKFLGANNSYVEGFLYTGAGGPLRSLRFTTLADLGTLDTYGLENGLYVLWLSDGSSVYSCKFIILR
jgi:hypothetical protein